MQINSLFSKSPLQVAHAALDTAVVSYGALTGGVTDSFAFGDYAKGAGMISAFVLHGGSACWHTAQAAQAYNDHLEKKGKDPEALPDCRAHLLLGGADLMSATGIMAALSGSTVFGPALVACGTATKLLTRSYYLSEQPPAPVPKPA